MDLTKWEKQCLAIFLPFHMPWSSFSSDSLSLSLWLLSPLHLSMWSEVWLEKLHWIIPKWSIHFLWFPLSHHFCCSNPLWSIHLATARRRPRCLGLRLWRLARAAKLAALLARMGSLVELGDFSDFQQEKWRFHQGNVWYSLRYQELRSFSSFL